MDEIKEYLEMPDPVFDQGFGLFCKFSRNQSLMAYIGRKREAQMLRYELQKLVKMGKLSVNPHHQAQQGRFNKSAVVISDAPTKSLTVELGERVHIMDERRVNREDLTEELKNLYDQITEEYKLQRSLHEKMKQANSDLGRKEFREQIMALQNAIKSKWGVIDTALTAEIPEEPAPKKININTNRAYISKMLANENMTVEQGEAVKQRVEELLSLGEVIKPETLAKLKARGL